MMNPILQEVYSNKYSADAYSLITKLLIYVSKAESDLDLRGVEQLTDDSVFKLYNSKKISLTNILSVDLTGCHHITDASVRYIAKGSKNLKKVVLDGCQLVTEVGLHYLLSECTQLEEVSLRAAGVTHVPRGVGDQVKLCLDGCPLICPHVQGDEADLPPFPQDCQLLVLGNGQNVVWVLDYLQTGTLTKCEEDVKMRHTSKAEIPGFEDVAFNVVECSGKMATLIPFLCPRSVVMLYLDMETSDNIQLIIMNRINIIKAEVPKATVIVLLGHKRSSPHNELRAMQLGPELKQYLKAQDKVIENDLLSGTPSLKEQDFPEQQQSARARLAVDNVITFQIYSIVVDTGKVVKHWPKPRDLEKEREDLKAQAEKLFTENWAPVMEQARDGLHNVSKKDIAEVKSYSSAPRGVMEICWCMAVILNRPNPNNYKMLLSDMRILNNMMEYDPENITRVQLKKLEIHINNPDFEADQLRKKSFFIAVCRHWVGAMHFYGTKIKPELDLLRAKIKSVEQEIEDMEKAYAGLQMGGPSSGIEPNMTTSQETSSDVKQIQEEIINKETAWNKFYMKPLSEELGPSLHRTAAELGSLKNPPAGVGDIMKAVGIILQIDEKKLKNEIKSRNFYKLLMNFDMGSVTQEILDRIRPCVEDPNLSMDMVRKKSKGAQPLKRWIEAVYQYNTDHKPTVEALQLQLEQANGARADMAGDVGVDAVREGLKQAVALMQHHYRIEDTCLLCPQVEKVLQIIESLKEKKVVPAVDLWKYLDDAEDWFSFHSLQKLLERLHAMGRIMYCSTVTGQPVITDISWFASVGNVLLTVENRPDVQTNEMKVRFLAPELHVIEMADCLKNIADKEQQVLLEELLLEQGFLLKLPCSPTHMPTSEWALFVYPLIDGDTYLRLNPEYGRYSTFLLRETLWPELGVDENMVQIALEYDLTAGEAASFLPQLFSEFARMGHVIAMSHFSCYVRHGCVELLIRNDVHGTRVSNTLHVAARCVYYLQSISQSAMREYIWSVLSRYLTVIDYHIQRSPRMHAVVKLICPGKCYTSGRAHQFMQREVSNGEKELNCPKCLSSEVTTLLQGRRFELPFHDYKDVFIPGTDNLSQSLYPWPDSREPHSDDINKWMCTHCGIRPYVANRLWLFQALCYPSFAAHCLDSGRTNDSQDFGRGNVFTPSGRRQGMFLQQDLECCSMQQIHVTIVQPGPLWILFADEEFFTHGFDKESDKLPSKLVPHYLDLKEGKHIQASADGTVSETALQQSVKSGDRLTVEVGLVRHPGSTDLECQFVVDLHILRNGYPLLELTGIPSNLHLGFVMEEIKYNNENAEDGQSGIPSDEPDQGHQPCVIIQCSSSPVSGFISLQPVDAAVEYRYNEVVQCRHMPVGSALLYRVVNNQWAIGQVLTIRDGEVGIGQENTGKTFFLPSSQDISPVDAHAEGLSVVINNELAKWSQLEEYCQEHGAEPLSGGFFPKTYVQAKKRCTLASLCPQVAELAMLNQQMRRQAMDVLPYSFILLPSAMTATKWANPCCHLVSDLTKQLIHPICIPELSSVAQSPLGHMVDIQGTEAGDVVVKTMLSEFWNVLFQAYHSLNNCPNFFHAECNIARLLPDEEERKSFLVDQMRDQLQMFFNIYMSILAFISTAKSVKGNHLNVTQMVKKRKIHDIVTKTVDQIFRNQGVLMKKSQKHCCDTHILLDNSSLVSRAAPFTPGDLGLMSSCVEDLNASHAKITIPSALQLLPNLSHVSLAFCGLTDLDCLKVCQNLKFINIVDEVTEIPGRLTNYCTTLTTLRISGYPIRILPDFVTELTNLQELSLPNAILKTLPDNIGNLLHLHTLQFKFIGDRLPASFANLQNLRYLYMSGTSWRIWPETETGSLTKEQWNAVKLPHLTIEEKGKLLSHCEFDKTKIQHALYKDFPRLGLESDDDLHGGVPPEIFSCWRLDTLIMSNHAFRHIPDAIGNLKQLRSLILDNCPELKTISAKLGQAVNLENLHVANCTKLHTPPQEIISQGQAALLGYIKRLSQGSVKCFRTKLMFVGLGGAGKTSLMRALMNTDSNCADQVEGEGITDGIDISKWSHKHGNDTLVYSVWDFAGQTVYYNTHQFFLSSRAVYLLIWNTRLGYEHSGLEFWLSSIACHCPTAPIFVIGTHADQISMVKIPSDNLMKRFPNIIGFHKVSSMDGTGMKLLRDDLVNVTMKQQYIGEQIPQAWLDFEAQILSQRQMENLLEMEEIFTIAKRAGIHGEEIQQAVRFLHSLGTLQHFDTDMLKDKVVINPQWIVDVMACLVSVHNNYVKDGQLKHEDIRKIWIDYPEKLHDWLLHLTEVFDLTFPLPEKHESIVPCLLPQKEPKYTLPEPDEENRCTKMIYRFEYLPAGLFNRAQVRLYEYSDHSSLWIEGSILKKRGHVALMKQTSATEVMVYAVGPQPENMLLLVHEVYESLITDFFRGVKYEYLLPCTDCLKENRSDPCMFSSIVLRKAVEMKALFVQCHKAFHIQSITEIQGNMLPQSNNDYDLQLQNTMRELSDLEGDLERDVFILYCPDNVPTEGVTALHPRQLRDDFQKYGINCFYKEELQNSTPEDVAVELKNAKVLVVLISTEFANDTHCQQLFEFAVNQLKKEVVLGMVGRNRDWQKSDIGMKLIGKLFVNLQRMNMYDEKLREIVTQIKSKLGENSNKRQNSELAPPEVFLSYCWVNSESAVQAGQAKRKDGAISSGDPREIKTFLEDNGIVTWLDIERTGRMGLYEDISEGMRECKVVVACVSDEYVQSANCQMEFRFAHIALRKPIVLAVVGTGFLWESTEIGMLSLGYPKINFQVANPVAKGQMLQTIQEILQSSQRAQDSMRPLTPLNTTTKEMEFQELFELAQRKFLRQITSYVGNSDSYPRLFVADFYQETKEQMQQGNGDTGADHFQGENGDIGEDQFQSGNDDVGEGKYEEDGKPNLSDIYNSQFCIKLLCEHEKGWHEAGAGFIIDLAGPELLEVWKRVSPFMARIMAILKHSSINLLILQTPEGRELLNMLEKFLAEALKVDPGKIYLILRRFLQQKDTERTCGGLARCYLPNGKILWLCELHRRLPRVSVLESAIQPQMQDDVKPETKLLTELRSLEEGFMPTTEIPSLLKRTSVMMSSALSFSRPPSGRRQPYTETKATSGQETKEEPLPSHEPVSSRPSSSGQADAAAAPVSGNLSNVAQQDHLGNPSGLPSPPPSIQSSGRSSTGRYQQLLKQKMLSNNVSKKESLILPGPVAANVARHGSAQSQACCIL